jgi:nucleoside-diphosphate-sugar epimerase
MGLKLILLLFFTSDCVAFAPLQTLRSSTALHAAALIVQNKGGGHGELGYQLAKALEGKVDFITILQDDACNEKKEPFQSYGSDLGHVKIIKAPLGDDSLTADALQNILGDDSKYEYIWDNFSKNPEGSGKALCDAAAKWKPVLYCYVSSAGIYQPDSGTAFPMPETTPVKESSGQNQFDQYAVSIGLPLVSFRPQYIYGPKANKHDYIDWYFDRLVRELPLPIPSPGTQKVSLTCSEDVASLLIAPLSNPDAAVEQRYFNCGTDELLTYDDLAYMCAAAAGIPNDKVMIEHYDSKMFGKADFPFRMTDFYVAPDMVKNKLNWQGPKHALKEALKWYYDGYKARGGPEKKMSLVKDWEIVFGSITSRPENVGSIYEKYDPIELDTSNVKELKMDL